MRVTNNQALRVELLRGREVVGISIDKVSSFEVADGHADCKLGVGGD